MRTVISMVLFIVLCPLVLNAQDEKQSIYSAEVEIVFTGRVENQYDSVFQVRYLLNPDDLQYRIKEVSIGEAGEKVRFTSSNMLSGNESKVKRSGNKIVIEMGEFKAGQTLKSLRYTDTKGNIHDVVLKTPD